MVASRQNYEVQIYSLIFQSRFFNGSSGICPAHKVYCCLRATTLTAMSATIIRQIIRIKHLHDRQSVDDCIVVEAPLEILIGYSAGGKRHRAPIAATLRTPGDDFNLVAGWLLAEGIVYSASDIQQIRYWGNSDTILVELSPTVPFSPEEKQRRFPISSACGWCGRQDNSDAPARVVPHTLQVTSDCVRSLPNMLREGQGLFSATGGAHAVALTDGAGTLLKRCEDVGRHNALDKLLGAMLRQNQFPLHQTMAVFSGRLGHELVQKSIVGGIQILCSIGAPSSAALEMAEAYGITVCGFVRQDGFNLYCGAERIIQP
jgi:FdhD protein